MSTRSCALCLRPIPDDQPALQARVWHYRTRARRNGWSRRTVVCTDCAGSGYRPASLDGRRQADVPLPSPWGPAAACQVCELPVILRADNRRRVFVCSDVCRARFYVPPASSVGRAVTACAWCGQPLTGRLDRRYCSAARRQRAHGQRVSTQP